jgi:GTP cyclohydrolase I
MKESDAPRGAQPARSEESWADMLPAEPIGQNGHSPLAGEHPPVDEEKIQRAVLLLLEEIGEDPAREGLRETPRRIAQMYRELFAGMRHDPAEVLHVSFDEGHSEMVIVKDIPFYTMCEHHFLPFYGLAHVGYLPRGRVVGISKLARAVEILARRPQLQERLTSQLSDSIMTTLEPHGVGVEIEGEHHCYDRETEILTTQGWVRFDRLEKGVAVAHVDPNDLSLTFVEPLEYIRYHYQGSMMRWQSRTVDLCVTPDHRVVMKSEWKFLNGGVPPWDVIAIRDVPPYFYVPQAVKWNAPDIAAVEFAGEQLPGYIYAAFMGIWLAEGCTRKLHHDVVISQDVGEKAAKIWDLLQRLPFRFRRIIQGKRSDHIHFKSSDRRLFDALAPFGKSGDKMVPAIIKQMSTAQIEHFMDWYGMGDGYQVVSRSIRWHYVSKSHRLIDDIQELLLRTGKTGAVQTYENCSRIETRVYRRESGMGYKWYGRIEPAHRTEIPFDDEVFCVSVPTGALLVRRNGRPIVSGNCMQARGVKKPGSKVVTSAMRGAFKNVATRAEFLALIREGK